jgi:lysophospholipase L1-like esterase
MKFRFVSRLLAATVAASFLAACSGNSGSTPSISPPTPGPANPTLGFTGLGDSLTAGEQSGGIFGGFAPAGTPSVPDPLCVLPDCAWAATGIGVPPTQENGFWSQIWMQMNGASQVQYIQIASPGSSVLPLIAGPGLGNQIVPASPSITKGPPFATLPGRSGCDSFNQAAYSPQTVASTVRENPTTMAHDIGIPGMTLHEAIAMNQPPSPTCVPFPGAPPTLTGLQQLLSESGSFYPVLTGFPFSTSLTPLNAAVSLRPSLTTVWLGANDVLHYAFSGGQFTAIDGIGGNTAQVQQDMTKIITTLQNAGSKVVVANLPDVLGTPFYMSVAPLPSVASCGPPFAPTPGPGTFQTFLACVLAQGGVPYAVADAVRGQVATAYGLNPGAGGNSSINNGYGYVTLGGTITILTALGGGTQPNLDPNGKGTGLGSEYVTPALANNIQTLNTTVNTGIGAAVKATGVGFVDIHTFFSDVATGCQVTGCGSDPLAAQALTLNPGKCCTLAFGGGLVSFDGIHPSNTGYAFIAQAFIQAIDAKYSLSVPPLNVQAQYAGSGGTIPYPDPYAQH